MEKPGSLEGHQVTSLISFVLSVCQMGCRAQSVGVWGGGSAPCLGVTTGNEIQLRLPTRADGRKTEARKKSWASFKIRPRVMDLRRIIYLGRDLRKHCEGVGSGTKKGEKRIKGVLMGRLLL